MLSQRLRCLTLLPKSALAPAFQGHEACSTALASFHSALSVEVKARPCVGDILKLHASLDEAWHSRNASVSMQYLACTTLLYSTVSIHGQCPGIASLSQCHYPCLIWVPTAARASERLQASQAGGQGTLQNIPTQQTCLVFHGCGASCQAATLCETPSTTKVPPASLPRSSSVCQETLQCERRIRARLKAPSFTWCSC